MVHYFASEAGQLSRPGKVAPFDWCAYQGGVPGEITWIELLALAIEAPSYSQLNIEYIVIRLSICLNVTHIYQIEFEFQKAHYFQLCG